MELVSRKEETAKYKLCPIQITDRGTLFTPDIVPKEGNLILSKAEDDFVSVTEKLTASLIAMFFIFIGNPYLCL